MTRRRTLSIIANVTGAVIDTDKAEALIAPMLSDHRPRCRVSDTRRQISFLRILRREYEFSGEHMRPACWRWRPRHRELLFFRNRFQAVIQIFLYGTRRTLVAQQYCGWRISDNNLGKEQSSFRRAAETNRLAACALLKESNTSTERGSYNDRVLA